MKQVIAIICLILVVFMVGCSAPTAQDQKTTEQTTNTAPTQETKTQDTGIINKVIDSFSSDASKLERDFKAMNDENQTFFTNVQISKDGQDIKMDFTVTPNATSKMILNIFTLGISIKTYNVTQGFENLKINYLNDKKQILGSMTIPKKAIKDVADYSATNKDADFMDNPYVEAFWKISQRMYDESVPELIPASMAEGMFGGFGSDADDIADALTKTVTHLEIDCNYAKNWDADADDDGITYSVKPLAADGTVVPIEGSFDTKVYEKVQTDNWDYVKGKLLYTQNGDLKGQDRLQYFDTWDGYSIQLAWDDVEPFMASSSNYGIMYVTYTDLNGKSFEAKTGEDSFGGCQLRE
ncbi:hypothetical protein C4573_06320 [Candidatus Woesearchaeota archaeon]|nr:MAG: hypothetical protein C4573_06320 [Candidatus Woesearchaeota archaeon]